jgi:hypothetical protein
VGIIGYYAQQPMIDFAGLIQPEIAVQLGQTGSYSAAASWAITLSTCLHSSPTRPVPRLGE